MFQCCITWEILKDIVGFTAAMAVWDFFSGRAVIFAQVWGMEFNCPVFCPTETKYLSYLFRFLRFGRQLPPAPLSCTAMTVASWQSVSQHVNSVPLKSLILLPCPSLLTLEILTLFVQVCSVVLKAVSCRPTLC